MTSIFLPVIAMALFCSGAVDPLPGMDLSAEWYGSTVLQGGGWINFQDTSSVVCANCHADFNQIGPLWAPSMEDTDMLEWPGCP